MDEEEIARIAAQRIKEEKANEKSSTPTDSHVHREAQRRIESERAAPAPAPRPTREQWMSYNPGGDYGAAMRERDANPMNVVTEDSSASNFAETQARLAEAAKRLEEKKSKEGSGSNIAGTLGAAYSEIPDDLKPLVLGGAGVAAGKVLRSTLPQEHVIGTPEYLDKQQQYKTLVRSEDPAYRAATQAYNTMVGSEQQHFDQQKMLEQQRLAAQLQHEAHLDELRRAQAAHAHAQTLTFEDEMARRSGAPTTTSAPQLTFQPRGGEGSQNYALKFGAGEEEARRVPSMSVMQQQNIPAQQQAWQKISNIAPTFDVVKESPLILGTEGQQAVRERVGQQQQQKTHVETEQERLRREIARRKAEAQIRLENAQETARLSARAAEAANKAHAAHVVKPPITAAHQSAYESTRDALADIQEKIIEGKQHPLARFGAKVAGRFVPTAGAAFAPLEAEAAKREWENKNYGRAAIHGLGTVGALAQATGVPLLMGAGDIAQIPAAGLAAYDLFSRPTKD